MKLRKLCFQKENAYQACDDYVFDHDHIGWVVFYKHNKQNSKLIVCMGRSNKNEFKMNFDNVDENDKYMNVFNMSEIVNGNNLNFIFFIENIFNIKSQIYMLGI